MDRILSVVAMIAVYLGCCPKKEICYIYPWKASTVAYARVQGTPELTERMIDDWCFWEVRYAALGYRPFSLHFLEFAASHHDPLIDQKWHTQRPPGERVILHACRFRQNFRKGASP
jgi:hypothetical protein